MDPHRISPIPPDAGISVIVPVRDFAALPRFRDAWETQLGRLGRPVEFHVVEDANLGPAMRAGLALATHPLVLFIIPDFAYRPGDLRALFDGVNEADIALGVRPGQSRPALIDKLIRIGHWIKSVIFGIAGGELAAWYGFAAWRTRLWRRVRFGLRAQDPECGLRLVRRAMLDRCPIQSEGGFALVEMIVKINFAGGVMIEVPLGKPNDLPTMPSFPSCPGDERSVFRKPVFNPAFSAAQIEPETKKPEEGHSSG